MKNPTTLDVDGVGPVYFACSRRARRVVISIAPSKGVRVAVPARVSLSSALGFVELKKPWIKKHLVKIQAERARGNPIAAALRSIDREEAARRLADRLDRLAAEHGFTYDKVSIRNQRTRWGSCCAKNISLNVKLAALPEELSDYVMLHELVHTRIHNHGKGFWEELERLVADARNVSKRLRAYNLT